MPRCPGAREAQATVVPGPKGPDIAAGLQRAVVQEMGEWGILEGRDLGGHGEDQKKEEGARRWGQKMGRETIRGSQRGGIVAH